MYARYIPPPKASKAASSPPPPSAPSGTPPGQAPAPVDGYSYARYVPGSQPAKEQPAALHFFSDDDGPKTPKRKREPEDEHRRQGGKKARTRGEQDGVRAAGAQGGQGEEASDGRKMKKKNRRKRKKRTMASDDDESQDSEDGSAGEPAQEEDSGPAAMATERDKPERARRKPEAKHDKARSRRVESVPGAEDSDVTMADAAVPARETETVPASNTKGHKEQTKTAPASDINGHKEETKTAPASDTKGRKDRTKTISASNTKGHKEESKAKDKAKKKKKLSQDIETAPEPPEKGEQEEETRHKAVLERKAKSLKLASKAARGSSPAPDGEAEEEPAEPHGLEPLPQPAVVADDESKPTYDALPSWLANPVRVSQDARQPFEELGIPAKAARVLKQKGFPEAFAIQTAAIPLLLPTSKHHPGDVLISAATGSGKTLAYALPMVRDIGQGVVTRLRALVVLPTRELVKQAQEVFETCARAYDSEERKKVRVGVAVGNQSIKAEQQALVASESRYDPEAYAEIKKRPRRGDSATGDGALDVGAGCVADEDPRLGAWEGEVVDFSSRVDVLICTPGRLVEHVEQTAGFSLDHVRWLVVDEADKLLAQSFQGWLELVMDRFRAGGAPGARDFADAAHAGVRKVVVSATLTRDLGLASRLELRRPRLLVLEGRDGDGDAQRPAEHALPTSLREFAVRVHDAGLKPLYLLELLRGGHLQAGEGLAGGGDGDGGAALTKPGDGDGDGGPAVAKPEDGSAALPGSDPDAGADADVDGTAASSDSDTSSSASSDDGSDADGTAASSDSDTSSDTSSDDGSDDDSDAAAGSGTEGEGGQEGHEASPPLPPHCLVFTKSNESTLRLARLLVLLDGGLAPHVATLASTTPTHVRRKTLRAFTTAASPVRVVIASDLVARGVDIPRLGHVVNYDLPASVAGYVHRVGRTARAGRGGCAWTLVADDESGWFWGRIAKGGGVGRAHRVERTRLEEMDGGRTALYEDALARLGREAFEVARRG